VRIVRISEIATSSLLTTDERVDCVAMALQELALAEALRIVHGRENAARRYADLGGHVRFDDEGEPVLVLEDRS